PVLIRIDNQGGLLKPGMNADVKIAVGERRGVLAIPNAALRTEKDVVSAGQVLGIPQDELTKMLESAKKEQQLATQQAADSGNSGAPLQGDNGRRGGNGGGQQGAGNGQGGRGGGNSAMGAGQQGNNNGAAQGNGGQGGNRRGQGGQGQTGNGNGAGNGQGG